MTARGIAVTANSAPRAEAGWRGRAAALVAHALAFQRLPMLAHKPSLRATERSLRDRAGPIAGKEGG